MDLLDQFDSNFCHQLKACGSLGGILGLHTTRWCFCCLCSIRSSPIIVCTYDLRWRCGATLRTNCWISIVLQLFEFWSSRASSCVSVFLQWIIKIETICLLTMAKKTWKSQFIQATAQNHSWAEKAGALLYLLAALLLFLLLNALLVLQRINFSKTITVSGPTAYGTSRLHFELPLLADSI